MVRFRFHSPLPRRKMVPPATAVAATRSASDSILRCREGEWFRLQNATTPPMDRFLISGSDLGIDAGFSLFTLSYVHRFLISGSDLRIDAGFHAIMPCCVHRFLISSPDLGIDAATLMLQLRIARLQRSRGVQAGTGCHEGGIILSKKPPEWDLSLPQQRSASSSKFRCGREEWFRLQHGCLSAGRGRVPRRRHNPK